jgi:hypothetical protein
MDLSQRTFVVNGTERVIIAVPDSVALGLKPTWPRDRKRNSRRDVDAGGQEQELPQPGLQTICMDLFPPLPMFR